MPYCYEIAKEETNRANNKTASPCCDNPSLRGHPRRLKDKTPNVAPFV